MFPLARVEREMADARLGVAVEAVCARHPQLAEAEIDWFGHRLAGDSRGRYHALGFLADPEAGLGEGRGFVVDAVSRHVIREMPIERRRDLPVDVSALA
jgi:hypothetical protein